MTDCMTTVKEYLIESKKKKKKNVCKSDPDSESSKSMIMYAVFFFPFLARRLRVDLPNAISLAVEEITHSASFFFYHNCELYIVTIHRFCGLGDRISEVDNLLLPVRTYIVKPDRQSQALRPPFRHSICVAESRRIDVVKSLTKVLETDSKGVSCGPQNGKRKVWLEV